MKVCLSANALDYPTGGGHLWVALNWALGLRALGCDVIWMERAQQLTTPTTAPLEARLAALQNRLAPYGLAGRLAIWQVAGVTMPSAATQSCLDLEAAAEADLLLNLQYFAPSAVVDRFRRSALIDIDPGLLQLWVGDSLIPLARHDQWFTIGETVGQPGARIPDLGLRWQYTPPCVALDWWPARAAEEWAPFTTLSHWWAGAWLEDAGEWYDNTKRAGFLPFLDLPRHTSEVLELALHLEPHEDAERAMLRACGWRVRESAEIASTPWDYQRYVQASRGEFSCAKPSCLGLENAWISDRTPCYLASGKPAVVQHTGASRFLPDAEGLFRFHDRGGAAHALESIAADYDGQCARARGRASGRGGALRRAQGSRQCTRTRAGLTGLGRTWTISDVCTGAAVIFDPPTGSIPISRKDRASTSAATFSMGSRWMTTASTTFPPDDLDQTPAFDPANPEPVPELDFDQTRGA